MAFSLHRLLRQIQITAKRSISTQNSTIKHRLDVFSKTSVACFKRKDNDGESPHRLFVGFTPRSVNLVKDLPSSIDNVFKIIKLPVIKNWDIDEPLKSINVEKVDDFPTAAVELPGLDEHVIEKRAARLLIIRKNKMKKHKLRKLRKRMRFEWGKRRQKREMRKEKAFQAKLIAQIHKAEQFDAANYVSEKIRKATEVPIPKLWKGRRLPEFIIRQKLGLDKK